MPRDETLEWGSARTRAPAKQPLAHRLFAYGGFDFPFMLIVTVLLCVGLVMMFSASYVNAVKHHEGDAYYFIKRQAVFAALGVAAMLGISKINLNVLRKLAIPGLGVAFLLLVVVLFYHTDFYDFKRWIPLPGGMTIQPSELAKMALILFFAYAMEKFQRPGYAISRDAGLISGRGTRARRFMLRWWTTGLYMGVLLAMVALIALENHVSGMIITAAIGALMIFIGEQRIPLWVYAGGIAFVVLIVLVIFKNPGILPDHAAARIESFKNPMADIQGDGWQTYQSLLAVGSGGWFGQGWGNSIQKHLYLPEPQNDFVFAIVCEELGLIGAAIVLFLFAVLIIRGYWVALHSRDSFGCLLATGVTTLLALQVFLNVAVVTSLVPVTGISMPFFSSGGTALLINLAEMGIVLAVSRQMPAPTIGN